MAPTNSGGRRSGSGRIRPDQRDTNDDAPKIGSHLPKIADLAEKRDRTTRCGMTDSCRRNYRCRIQAIIKFWKEEDPDYYQIGVRKVPAEEYNNEMNYYFPKSAKTTDEDIVYEGLNEEYVMHFFVHAKLKIDGKLCSETNLRKFKDAIVWGSTMAKQRLPILFYEEVDSFLKGYKKEFTQEKKGNVEDTSSDPITIALYQMILKWRRITTILWYGTGPKHSGT